MEKNILVTFLSDVKTVKDKTGKITIRKTPYENVDGEPTQTTNESAVRYLLQETSLDKIFIFASEKVRKEEIIHVDGTKYLGEDDKPRTHLQFFLERIGEFLPNVSECVEKFSSNDGEEINPIYEYNEDGTESDNLKSVVEMAERIQKFAAKFKDEKIFLYVDLTGGMRHVNILMLELARLLEYSGLTVKNVLYSNYNFDTQKGKVEPNKNVYDLFQLIAGIEEFVNFGSVQILEKYYNGKETSSALKRLRDAMKKFAEEIKLCHYGQFRDAIIKLHDAVNDFDKDKTDDVEDTLMARLIGRIHEDYHALIVNRDAEDLDIAEVIRWCLKKDYIQQALTLYTERIPEYLGKKKFIELTAEESARLEKAVKANPVRYNNFYYLLVHLGPKKDSLEEGNRKYFLAIKINALNCVRTKNINIAAWFKDLNEKIAPLRLSVEDESRLRAQLETFNKLVQHPEILKDLSSPELEPIREIINAFAAQLEDQKWGKARKKIILDELGQCDEKKFAEFFPKLLFGQEAAKKFPRSVEKNFYKLLVEGSFNINVSEETFLTIMETYLRIKDERNHTNHALEDKGALTVEFGTTEKLRDFIGKALDYIKENTPAQ